MAVRITGLERTMMALVAEGYTDEEIGQAVQIDGRKVSDRLKYLRVKIGARNRAHLATIGLRRGLIPLQSPAGTIVREIYESSPRHR